MKHGIVYAEPGVYAGWPANHGAWQWGNQFLVGFLRGKHVHKSMHNIAEPFEKVHARSNDGGETWSLEKPDTGYDPFECLSPTPFGVVSANNAFRVCGVYDHGGDNCNPLGGFFLSPDHGRLWKGPYLFNGLDAHFTNDFYNSSRTCVLDDLFFLSSGVENCWGQDFTFCARLNLTHFEFVSTVCDTGGRAVMPAAARTGDRIVVALRRRNVDKHWIELFHSDDNAKTWLPLVELDFTGKNNGNPPALLALPDGRLVCTYGNRTQCAIRAAVSKDRGESWQIHILRQGEYSDIGYPRLFLRNDGQVVCVYYWKTKELPAQHIAYTIWET